eukprot:5525227-Alexandrium_andersonii.AAC.1
MAKDGAACGLAGCGLEFALSHGCGLGAPQSPLPASESESARKVVQNGSLGSFGATSEAVPGPAQFQ